MITQDLEQNVKKFIHFFPPTYKNTDPQIHYSVCVCVHVCVNLFFCLNKAEDTIFVHIYSKIF